MAYGQHRAGRLAHDLAYTLAADHHGGCRARCRPAILRYAEGEAFTVRAAKTITHIGEGLSLVVLFKGFVVPTVLSWVAGENGIEMQFADYDLGVAFAGAAVMSIGYVMRQAVAIKTESDQIV